MGNQTQAAAKAAKNDEFYTQYHDIEIEVNAYLEYDPDVFRGKTVLLPCDDPEWSNFTKFFAQKFEVLGLKKLISTSFAPDSKKYKYGYQPSLFEQEDPQFDIKKTQTQGKIFVLSEVRKCASCVTKQISSSPTRHSRCSASSWRGLCLPVSNF